MVHFKKISDFLALKGSETPTKAELDLIKFAQAGLICNLARERPDEAQEENRVRATLLRHLIMGGDSSCEVHERGVRLCGGWIEGVLNLDHCTAHGGISLQKCRFSDTPNLIGATFQMLDFEGSLLPGILAPSAVINGNIRLNEIESDGGINLNGAKISGRVFAQNAKIRQTSNADGYFDPSIIADEIEVEGGVDLSRLEADGGLRFVSAKIGGSLALQNARISPKDSRYSDELQSRGRADRGSEAFNAHMASINGHLLLTGLRTAAGAVDISGAKIGGKLDFSKADIDGGIGRDGEKVSAINAQSVEVGLSTWFVDIKVKGEVHLSFAKISGQLRCIGAKLDSDRNLRKETQFPNSEGKSKQGLSEAGYALRANGISVEKEFIWRNISSVIGLVDLSGAHVGILADEKESWHLDSAKFLLGGFTYDSIDSNSPREIRSRESWLRSGLSKEQDFFSQPYTQLSRVLREAGDSAAARQVLVTRTQALKRSWRLQRQVEPNGDCRVGLRSIWVDLTNFLHFLFWDIIPKGVAGYGYFPIKSAIYLLALFILAVCFAQLAWDAGTFAPNSAVVLTSHGWAAALEHDCLPILAAAPGCDPNPAKTWSDDPARGVDWDSFNAIAYGADLVVPFLDLGQTAAWAPSKDRGCWGYFLWFARWILATFGWGVTGVGVASVTGIMQRNQPD